MTLRGPLLSVALLALMGAGPSCDPPRDDGDRELIYPAAVRSETTDVYHGVEVADPFRALEDLESDATRHWMRSQDDLLASFLEPRSGTRDRIAGRIRAIREIESRSLPVRGGASFFYTEQEFGADQPALYRGSTAAAEAPSLVFDPDERLEPGERYRGAFFPDPSGSRVAIQWVPAEGSGMLLMDLLDAATGESAGERLEGVWGAVSWRSDGSGFYYARFPERPAGDLSAEVGRPVIYFHRVGTPQASDPQVFAGPRESDWLLRPRVSADGRYLIISASGSNFTGLHEQVFLIDLDRPETEARALFSPGDARYSYEGNRGERFWFQTTHGAPNRRLIELDLGEHGHEPGAWRELIAETPDQLTSVSVYPDRLVLTYTRHARPRVVVADWRGVVQFEVELPGVGLLNGLRDDLENGEAFYTLRSLFDPGTIFRLDTETGASEAIWRPRLAHDPDGFEIRQVFFESGDGTRVPMFLAGRTGFAADRPAPTFMYGYGTLGWSAVPWYQPHVVAWMEMGGLYALPGVRGGGEYGEAWRRAGAAVNKQNGIDDYLAAAEWLVDEGYTSPSLLVANGGSASGVLAAAAVLQRPELFAASVIDIPSLDMLRYHLFAGARYTMADFGTVEDPDEFEALLSYSPYQNIRPGVCYPPLLVMAGEKDATAVPLHGYKFVARLQAEACAEQIALLKVMWGAGHGYGTTPEQWGRSWGDAWAFLIEALDLELAEGADVLRFAAVG